ncbi:myosin regulatory light chain, smooth muscle-like isoform X1 [Octopus vulgaris]|uniref:Myosin regulatory light chain, smooth muscle-like isoform X1 n=2 Tax=Octopus TaxID=6643 RepID=A0AA36BLX1_OCTVU|nr:myosin regulatory light chain LC-2, mantle muscle isoform X1 [Octopus sinensis]CAI9736424.1 myosin regulatory light chain, smooth muscle-like isoform X1 [Octopus vulgaris]
MAEEAASRKKTNPSRPRTQRATSNIFAMFNQNQIQEFKEAFTMIDQDRDGFIGMEDLKDMFSSLGRVPSDEDLKGMLKECPGQLNFTSFLTLFGDKVSGTDPEGTLRNAFCMFDEDNQGFIPEDYLKDLLENMGDNFTKEEIKNVWKDAPLDNKKFDYNAMVDIIKGKSKEDEE